MVVIATGCVLVTLLLAEVGFRLPPSALTCFEALEALVFFDNALLDLALLFGGSSFPASPLEAADFFDRLLLVLPRFFRG